MLLNTEQAAEWLGLSAQWLIQARLRGQGPRLVRIHKLIRYRVGDLRDYVTACIVDPGAKIVPYDPLDRPAGAFGIRKIRYRSAETAARAEARHRTIMEHRARMAEIAAEGGASHD